MKKLFALALLLTLTITLTFSQDKLIQKEYQPGYYQNTIEKGIDNSKDEPSAPRKYFKIDVTGKEFPNDPALYTKVWYNDPVSQGKTGTCWCFSTTSFYESEVNRITGMKVKLSEMFPVYWEYVERAKYFVQKRGTMNFGEGSETNAVKNMYKQYGIVPEEAYEGKWQSCPFHDHSEMFDELDNYLKSVKEQNAWNEDEVIATTKSILNHYMGEPPTTVSYNGKNYTPQQYLSDVLKLKMDEYVDFMSLLEVPSYTQGEYKVGDNWWHDQTYYNVPLTDFTHGLKEALQSGYSISIGGDVSESGWGTDQNIGVVPGYDIPSSSIDDNARQLRFTNGSTTDDHAMHCVGYYDDKDGKTWFLFKDSGSGSRNVGETDKKFGYYFVSEDYVKLKMMTITVNKNAVKDLLSKFNKT